MQNLIDWYQNENIGTFKENISLKTLTTYKVGGNVRLVAYPFSTDTLIKLLKKLKKDKIAYKILGNGSNLLASDDNFNGVIIKLTNFTNFKLEDDGTCLVDAGYPFAKLANQVAQKGYSGLEFAGGIPGTIGGAIYMNAGAYLKSIGDVLVSINALDENFNIVTLKKDDLELDYRTSILKRKPYICLNATLKLEKKDKNEIKLLMDDRLKRRITTQPLEFPSAGSVFRNPENDYAGRLIEACNLKGLSWGGASISEKHANFIVNSNHAKAADIKYLMDLAKNKVKENFSIELICEQELFNWK